MSGFSVTAYSITLSQWLCLDQSNFTSEGVILMRSTSTFEVFSENWTAYLCVSLTQLTEASFRYYHLNDRQENAGQGRVYIYKDRNVSSPDTICNRTGPETVSEFHVIIKQGSEEQAKIECPAPLHGRFDYNITDTDGTTYCDEANTTYQVNVCTDKTTLAFDAPCSRSLVYASGDVYCVASVVAGNNTFVVVYNAESTVDNSNTFRFSCLAISDDSLQATIVPHNCTDKQSQTVLAKDHQGNDMGARITFRPLVFCKGACSWPTVFQSSTWRDNTRGDLTFTTTTMSGWSFSSYGSAISNWECLDTSDFQADGILLLKATDTFSHVGSTWVSYLCLHLYQVTTNSYYYYQQHSQQPNAAEERVKINSADTLATRAQICGSTAIPAAEFHFMVKSGFESTSTQYCPPSLLQKMDYTHTSPGSAVACAGSTDNWDVCTDRKIMTFDYTTCPQKMAYSDSGTVWCMVNLTSTHEYVVVYNTDASLSAGVTYRFSCFVVSSDGTKASMVYNNCTSVQTPTSYATTHDDTQIGALLTMSATCIKDMHNSYYLELSVKCPFLGPDTGEESPNLIPIIAGVIAGLIAIAIAIAVIVYCIKRKKVTTISHIDKDTKSVKSAATSNGTVPPIADNDLDKTPVSEVPSLTAEPVRQTLAPLPTQINIGETLELSPRHIDKLPPINSAKSG